MKNQYIQYQVDQKIKRHELAPIDGRALPDCDGFTLYHTSLDNRNEVAAIQEKSRQRGHSVSNDERRRGSEYEVYNPSNRPQIVGTGGGWRNLRERDCVMSGSEGLERDDSESLEVENAAPAASSTSQAEAIASTDRDAEVPEVVESEGDNPLSAQLHHFSL